MRCSKIIISKAKTVGETNCIQVFGPYKCRKRFNAKVKESTDIRQVF